MKEFISFKNITSQLADITVIGGGAVGMIMTLALAKLGKKIILIEKMSREHIEKPDGRSIALSYTSVCMLQSLGVWEGIKNQAEKIKQVHVSGQKNYSQTTLTAEDESLPFLGIVIKMQHLLPTILKLLNRQKNIDYWSKTQVTDLKECNSTSNHYKLIVEREGTKIELNSALIIAADGAHSPLRTKAKIDTAIHDYQQSALVFEIDLRRSHYNCAYERFLQNGVMAMLPLGVNKMACVWTVNHDEVEMIRSKPKQKLLSELQNIFSYRLGRFVDHSPIGVFPLSLIQAKLLYKKNLLLFGNASHFLHPISGQGLNLSMRDVGVLYDLVAKTPDLKPIRVQRLLDEYVMMRQFDHKRTAALTHSAISTFMSQQWSIKLLRNIGLHLLERDHFLKQKFSQLMMGKFNYGSTLLQELVL